MSMADAVVANTALASYYIEAAGRKKLWPEIERLALRIEEPLLAVEEFVSGMAKPIEK